MHTRTIRFAGSFAIAAIAAAVVAATAPPARAEVREVRIAKGFGLGYLPLVVMEQERLFEKHAAAAGLTDTAARWLTFDGGTNQAYLLAAGNLEISSASVATMVTLWDRTRDNLDVRGIAAIGSLPLSLNTVNPDVRTVRDLTAADRIAVPVVKASIQAVVLQMQARRVFGAHDRLDRLTVSMAHPDAAAALLAGRGLITAHLTAAPFSWQELQDPRVRRVFGSYEVLDCPHSFNLAWTTRRFRERNPRCYAAFLAALDEAMDRIAADMPKCAAVFAAAEKSKLGVTAILEMMRDPDVTFTATPAGTMKFAAFLHEVGTIRRMPARWEDLFFPDVHDRPGS
jgi:NitT/TauT family transport system substrate-binding protein